MKQTPDKILNDILRNIKNPSEYTYIIMGKPGPTGKTWLCNKLQQRGYNACEITESVCWIVDYQDNGNHYLIKKQARVVVIILNAPLEPAKEMTLEEIEKKLGHRVKIVNNELSTMYYPIKTSELCAKCKYARRNSGCTGVSCHNCPCYEVGGDCKCVHIPTGQPCPYYEKEEEHPNE